MSIGSLFIARTWNLPPRLHGVRTTRNIAVPMADGVKLMTNLYQPRAEGPHPTILMRLPYGRAGFASVGEVYAERGFNVVLQACRGTEKSEGEFDPLVHEREDGLATLAWIEAQPWFDGRIGLSGPSYLGYAQWAICDALPETAALSIKVTSAEFRSVVFPGGAFHLGLWLTWLQIVEGLRGNPIFLSQRMLSGGIEKRTLKASLALPLQDADKVATNHKVAFWDRWLNDAVEDGPFWHRMDHRHRLGPNTPPNCFISGWYDFMLDQLLRDYQTLVDFGHTPYLTVGPWVHVSADLQGECIRDTLVWMKAKLMGDAGDLREKPVRLYIGGLDEWRDYDSYPPGPAKEKALFLNPGGALAATAAAGDPDHYTYDPHDPTPSVGGAMLSFTGAGMVDNAPLEARPDVLSFTGETLTAPLTVIGQTQVDLSIRTSRPFADLFVRLNDVGADGISRNICDGFLRITPDTPVQADGSYRLTMTLHATAHCFLAGHKLRVLVASGAHPRFARNTGTDEPIATATTLLPVEIDLLHAPPARMVLRTYDMR